MINKIFLQVTLFICVATNSFSQKADFRNGTIKQQNFCDTIPFDYVRNKIIITVKVNGVNKRFVFDTGAVLAISEELQSVMNYTKLGSVEVGDVNGKSSDAKIVGVKEMQIGNLTFQDIPSVVMDIKNTYPINCLNCDGIVGSNVFKNCIVAIDLSKKIIILTDNVQKLALQNAYQTPISINKIGKPYLQISLDNDISFEGLFDSGSDKLMSISDKIYDKAIKKGSATLLNEGFGITSIGINGIAAAEKKNRALIKQLKFGDATINNVVTIESEKTKNAFGIQLAEYGTITLDYINKIFYFVPLKQVQDYKNKKTLGFKDIPEKTFYAIGIVWTNTQAEKIGLKNGFQILKINNQDFTNRTVENDCLFALADFFKYDKINLTYKNDKGEVRNVELVEE
jgi:Aspartyl protease